VCPNLVSTNILNGNVVKPMTGSILAPNSGSIWKFRKILVAKWGKPTRKYLKNI
jgi:hypothetical protein